MAEVSLLSSKTVIREPAKKRPNIESVASNIGALVGVTERGPVGVATKNTSYEAWQKIFGKKIANSDSAIAAQAFFDGGGSELYQTRVVHYTNPAIPATKTSLLATLNLLTAASAPTSGSVTGSVNAPFNLEPGDTLSVAVDGGGPAVATFLATAASRTSAAVEPFALVNLMDLTISIDGGPVQTITFLTANFVSIGAATAAEVAAVINAGIVGAQATVSVGAVVITSDRRGTSSGVNITGGTANAILTFTTGNIAGTGNVANIDSVVGAEVVSVVNAAVIGQTTTIVSNKVVITSNTTGVGSSILVGAISTADDELGLDNALHSGTTGAAVNTIQVDGKYDGTYAHDITIRTSAPSSGAADEFDLIVLDTGVITEVYPNLNMISTSTKYFVTKINNPDTGSDLIFVTDLLAPLASPLNRPAFTTAGPLAGGDDGLVGLVDTDFLGDAAGLTGMHAMDQTEGIRLLAIPGRASSAIHNGMIVYCESTKKLSMWPIMDPPANTTASGMVTYVKVTAAIYELSEHGGIFWPRIKIANPDKTEFGNTDLITVPPSGHIMGAIARQASKPGGVYQAPAGVELGLLTGALALETDEVLDELKRDLIYVPALINPIVSKSNVKPFIDGVFTLKTTGQFPTMGERLGAIFIEQSVKEDMEFARHKNNTPALRAEVNRRITEFLLGQMRLNAFASTIPDEAFFVDTSDALNLPSVQKALQLKVRVGLAFASPAEFIILEFVQDTRALDAELAA